CRRGVGLLIPIGPGGPRERSAQRRRARTGGSFGSVGTNPTMGRETTMGSTPVACTTAWLLDRTGSVVVDVTFAGAVRLPPAVTLTTTWKVTLAPTASVPRLMTRFCPLTLTSPVLPAAGFAETNWRLVGRLLVIFTPLATPGPLFLTVIW